MSSRRVPVILVVVLTLVLSACGGSDPAPANPPQSGATEPTATSQTENPAAEATSAIESAARTVEHTMGNLEIEGTPERVIVLEWTYAEDLLALGVQPVGVADVDGYNTWVNITAELSSSVTDVGTRQEPSLETIAELEPDLIIGVQFRHEPIYETLSSIAPTLIFNPYPEDESITQFDEMTQTFMAIAEAVDRVDEGQTVLDEMQEKFDQAQADLEAAGAAGREIVFVQAYTSQNTPQLRVFIDSSMAIQIMQSIGLQNAWEGEGDIYGFNTVGVEALMSVEHADFLYIAQDDDNPFTNQLADNPAWNGLTFVEEDRIYPLGGDTWPFGGPLSAEMVVDIVVGALTE